MPLVTKECLEMNTVLLSIQQLPPKTPEVMICIILDLTFLSL